MDNDLNSEFKKWNYILSGGLIRNNLRDIHFWSHYGQYVFYDLHGATARAVITAFNIWDVVQRQVTIEINCVWSMPKGPQEIMEELNRKVGDAVVEMERCEGPWGAD